MGGVISIRFILDFWNLFNFAKLLKNVYYYCYYNVPGQVEFSPYFLTSTFCIEPHAERAQPDERVYGR